MPPSHRRLAAWYIQLAQQLEAGLTLAESLRATQGLGMSPATLSAMAATIDHGGSTKDAMTAARSQLPDPDRLALSASADAGRMPQTLRALAARHEQLGAAKLKILLACLYPTALVHLAMLVLPLMLMIDWNKGLQWSTPRYVGNVLAMAVPLWVLIAIATLLVRKQSPVMRQLATLLPGLRGYVRAQALSDLAFALGNFLEAGIQIGPAWKAAGGVSRSPQLRRASEAIVAAVDRGQPPGVHLASWPCFPPDFVAQYRNGERTGQLDATLIRLATQHQDAASRALTIVMGLYPTVIFLLVAGLIGYLVIRMYAGYLDALVNLTK